MKKFSFWHLSLSLSPYSPKQIIVESTSTEPREGKIQPTASEIHEISTLRRWCDIKLWKFIMMKFTWKQCTSYLSRKRTNTLNNDKFGGMKNIFSVNQLVYIRGKNVTFSYLSRKTFLFKCNTLYIVQFFGTISNCFISNESLNSSVSMITLNIPPQPPLVSSNATETAFGNLSERVASEMISALFWQHKHLFYVSIRWNVSKRHYHYPKTVNFVSPLIMIKNSNRKIRVLLTAPFILLNVLVMIVLYIVFT